MTVLADIEQLLSPNEQIKLEFVDGTGIKWVATNKRILNRKGENEGRIIFQDLDYRHITSFRFETKTFRYLIMVGVLLILFSVSLIAIIYDLSNYYPILNIVDTPVFANITLPEIVAIILIIKGVHLIIIGIFKRDTHCQFFAAGLYRQQPVIIKVKDKKGEEDIIKFVQIIRDY
jgi:hypothetical protein